MNNLQKTEFEMLKLFVDICEQLGLQYFLVCGTALGAVKYKGFIPWDDDVDVALPRRDYEIFVERAQAMLPEGIFLQNYSTDSSFPQIYSKLRNSKTAYIEKSVAHLPINHGVYIDVFPLDGYPKDLKQQKKLEYMKRVYQFLLLSVCDVERGTVKKTVCGLVSAFGFNRRICTAAEKFDRMVSEYSSETSDIWCNHGNWQGALEYAQREQYGNGVTAVFEGLQVCVPEKYDEYLTQKYGNWQADLPEEKKVGHHYYTVCDLNNSYEKYTTMKGKPYEK